MTTLTVESYYCKLLMILTSNIRAGQAKTNTHCKTLVAGCGHGPVDGGPVVGVLNTEVTAVVEKQTQGDVVAIVAGSVEGCRAI